MTCLLRIHESINEVEAQSDVPSRWNRRGTKGDSGYLNGTRDLKPSQTGGGEVESILCYQMNGYKKFKKEVID